MEIAHPQLRILSLSTSNHHSLEIPAQWAAGTLKGHTAVPFTAIALGPWWQRALSSQILGACVLGELQPLSEWSGTGLPILPSCMFFHALAKTIPNSKLFLPFSLFSHSFLFFFLSCNFWTYQYKYELSCWGSSLATPISSRHIICKLLWDSTEGKGRHSRMRSNQKCHTQDSYSRLPQCLRCPHDLAERVQEVPAPATTLRGKSRLLGWEELTAGSFCGTGRHCSPDS